MPAIYCCHYNNVVPEASTPETAAPAQPASGPRRFTLRQRIVLRIIITLGYWAIRLIGPTLRVCISREDGAQETLDQRPLIGSFWHSCIIPATYICRNLGVRVMSSNSYDGEYMGRIIHKFGLCCGERIEQPQRRARPARIAARARRRLAGGVHARWPTRTAPQSEAGPGRAGDDRPACR